MLLGDLLAHILDNALDAALQLRRNGFCRTFVAQQIPAENGARQCRRGLGCFVNRNNLVVLLQVFGTIIIMIVLIMEPVPLELNKIRTCHKAATDLALTPMAHRTATYLIFDAASVHMIEGEFSVASVGIKSFVARKLSLSRELHQFTHLSFKFTANSVFIHFGPFASDPALDNHILQNMACP